MSHHTQCLCITVNTCRPEFGFPNTQGKSRVWSHVPITHFWETGRRDDSWASLATSLAKKKKGKLQVWWETQSQRNKAEKHWVSSFGLFMCACAHTHTPVYIPHTQHHTYRHTHISKTKEKEDFYKIEIIIYGHFNQHLRPGMLVTCGNWFSPSSMWVPGTELPL